LDWRIVVGDEWRMVNESLNGAGVESVQEKWNELFDVKDEVEEKSKKPARKRTTKRTPAKETTTKKKTTGQKGKKKTTSKSK
jgi:hypothetical protein